MAALSFGPKWLTSPAHLYFLSEFLKPRVLDDYRQSEYWQGVLRESPERTIKQMMADGMLITGDLSECLDYALKIPELKTLLKERDLPTTGRKSDLIARLVSADPKGMQRATKGLSLLKCSVEGQARANAFLEAENKALERAHADSLEALRGGDFRRAQHIEENYRRERAYRYRGEPDMSVHTDFPMLEWIFQGRPKILAKVPEAQMRELRLVAGMMFVWGENCNRGWVSLDFQTGLVMDNEAAARMLLFYAHRALDLRQYRETRVVRKVEVLCTSDSCPACRKLSDHKYSLDKVPELPHEKCTSETGCRCVYVVAELA